MAKIVPPIAPPAGQDFGRVGCGDAGLHRSTLIRLDLAQQRHDPVHDLEPDVGIDHLGRGIGAIAAAQFDRVGELAQLFLDALRQRFDPLLLFRLLADQLREVAL